MSRYPVPDVERSLYYAGRVGGIGYGDAAFQKAASYIIRKSGDFYEAVNGATGQIDYGGSGNAGGVDGTDASAVIQACLDALTGSGKIFIKAGTYNISSAITLPYSRISVCGEGKSTILQATANIIMFDATAAQRFLCTFRDLTFNIDDRDTYTSVTAIKGIFKTCIFSNLWFRNLTAISLDFYSISSDWSARSYENIVTNCYFSTTTDSNQNPTAYITFRANSTDNSVVCNYMDSNNRCQVGINALTSAETIAENHIISCHYNFYTTAGAHRIENNFFDSSYYDCLTVKPSSAITGILILGNTFLKSGQAADNTYQSILLDATDANIMECAILGNKFQSQVSNKPEYHIKQVESTGVIDYIQICNNMFMSGSYSTGVLLQTSTTDMVRNNTGYITENSGSDSIANGTTSKVVAHGLDVTPAAEDFTIIGKENPTNPVGTIWIDNIGATNFTVNVENDPGASNWDFGWRVVVL